MKKYMVRVLVLVDDPKTGSETPIGLSDAFEVEGLDWQHACDRALEIFRAGDRRFGLFTGREHLEHLPQKLAVQEDRG